MDRTTAEPVVEELPGSRAEQWVTYHRNAAAKTTYVYDFVWDITEDAEGPFCTDADGNVLLDFTSHVGAAPLGYNNPKIMEPLQEFDLVDPLKIAGQDFYISTGETPDDAPLPGPAHLMNRLVELTSEYGMEEVFLSNSGAEAVENAMKICYDHCETPKYGITFDGAFHGRTLGALSLNRSKSVYRRKYPEISGIHDVEYSLSGINRLRKKLDSDHRHIPPEQVAFIALEPIQGEGGYRVPTSQFMTELNDISKEFDIPIIADEIQSGLGRSGEMWASDHSDLEPDVITSAKALRVGATISRSEIFPDERGRISSTWGAGDIIAAIQGGLTLAAIDEYQLLDNVRQRGEQLEHHLKKLEDSSEAIIDSRGLGLMRAVEFETPDQRDDTIKAALQRGFLTIGCGRKSIRFLPPLDVTEREIEIGMQLFDDAVQSST